MISFKTSILRNYQISGSWVSFLTIKLVVVKLSTVHKIVEFVQELIVILQAISFVHELKIGSISLIFVGQFVSSWFRRHLLKIFLAVYEFSAKVILGTFCHSKT